MPKVVPPVADMNAAEAMCYHRTARKQITVATKVAAFNAFMLRRAGKV